MKRIMAYLLMCAALLAGCTHHSAVYTPDSAGMTAVSGEEEQAPDAGVCYVYVCGAVAAPGVYRLPYGSRICDAIEAAGGFASGADETSVNLARLVEDEMQLRVYYIDEEAAASRGKVNINLADAETLMTLPGIGKAKAEAIIAYRKKHGGFSSGEELMQVEGIAEKLYEGLADLIET